MVMRHRPLRFDPRLRAWLLVLCGALALPLAATAAINSTGEAELP